MSRRPWTLEEDDLLRAFFASPDCSFAELASRLGRSIESVRQRASVLHLRLSPEVRSEIGRARWARVPIEKRRTMGRHLVALKQEQRHRALSTNAPPWCKLVRAAVEERFGGDHQKAAAACRQSLDDQPVHPNHLWEIMRGWQYVYSKVNGQRERQQILHPSRETVDRLCTGLPLNREKLLTALKESGGCLLEERRGQIMRTHNVPLKAIKDLRKRGKRKAQIAKMARTKRGRTSPKHRAARLAHLDALRRNDPKRFEERRVQARKALARFQHPSPIDRMRRGWGKIAKRRGGTVSVVDTEKFVARWSEKLGLMPKPVRRYVDEFRGTPRPGQQPDLDLYLYIRELKEDSKLTWTAIARRVAEKFNVPRDPESLKQQYRRFARVNFRPVKPRLRPFRARRRWSPQERELFRTLYLAGTPIRELADRFASTLSALKTLASRLRLRRRPLAS